MTISLTEVIEQQQLKSQYQKAALECLTHWQSQDIDVLGYTTIQNALDVNNLRQHLKAGKVTLWGISYGSHLALSAIKLFPEHLDKVVIASAEGLNQTVKLPAETDNYFQSIQALISTQALCQQATDLPALMRTEHTKLNESPMPLEIPNKDGTTTKMFVLSPPYASASWYVDR